MSTMATLIPTLLLALIHISVLAFGTPLEGRDVTIIDRCGKHRGIVESSLYYCSTATPFCSSFLGYTGAPPTVTATKTETDTSTISKTVTSRTTLTVAKGGTVTLGVLTTVVGTSTIYVTVTTAAAVCTGVSSVSYDYYYGSELAHVKRQGYQSFTTSTGPPAYKTTTTAKAPEDCGLRHWAIGAVSIGCSCFLDPTVTSTCTKVKKTTAVTTTTVTKHTTIRGTETVPSSTVTAASATTTVTAYTSASPTSCPTPDISCGNQGLEWAYIPASNMIQNLTDPNNIYSPDFEPANTKQTPPTYAGVTGEIGIDTTDGSGDWDIYGVEVPATYTLVNHRGYFFAPQDGDYLFQYLEVDDKGWTWLGEMAYSGWNASNADIYATYNSPEFSGYVTLVGGTYYPFRNYFAQGNGPGGLDYYVQAPDGTFVAVSGAEPSVYFVQFSCDGITAPAYPPFGSET